MSELPKIIKSTSQIDYKINMKYQAKDFFDIGDYMTFIVKFDAGKTTETQNFIALKKGYLERSK